VNPQQNLSFDVRLVVDGLMTGGWPWTCDVDDGGGGLCG